MRLGFRRSGAFTYRPYCDHCRECVPVRVPVATFVPNRAQRRSLRKHGALTATQRDLAFDIEHYALYLRYQRHRHPGGGMDQDSREQYQHFLLHSNVTTDLFEFREDGRLRMVSLVDRLYDGLSSVYTFYDPSATNASYGTYTVLWQLQRCLELQLSYLYLRYWIARHAEETGSPRANWILENWEAMLPKFVKVFPHEYKRVLGVPRRAVAAHG